VLLLLLRAAELGQLGLGGRARRHRALRLLDERGGVALPLRRQLLRRGQLPPQGGGLLAHQLPLVRGGACAAVGLFLRGDGVGAPLLQRRVRLPPQPPDLARVHLPFAQRLDRRQLQLTHLRRGTDRG